MGVCHPTFRWPLPNYRPSLRTKAYPNGVCVHQQYIYILTSIPRPTYARARESHTRVPISP